MDNLVKFIASSGAASRRQAQELIAAGNVAVNGETILNPAHRVSADETVSLDGRILLPAEKKWYILLHKPRGYVCSNADRHADKLAVELLKDIPARMVSAGRLDKDSEGAIIFSNDGDFINKLAHPRYGVLKRYIVHTGKALKDSDLIRMENGLTDSGEFLRAEAVKELKPKVYEFTLNEGKKREIRRMTAACKSTTVRLIRVSIGDVELGDLPAGSFRELTAEEVAGLRGDKL